MPAIDYVTQESLEMRLPRGAPGFLCPFCQCALQYEGSEPAAESDRAIDLSDLYTCPMGCGRYEHVRRTHRLRLVKAP